MLVDTSRMINIEKLESSNLEHPDELQSLAYEAQNFLKSHEWCKRIVLGMFDRDWGYIMAVFYFIIEPATENIPENIWVIVGDLPPAYIDVEDNPNGACAVDAYVIEMQKWIDQVMRGGPITDFIPVNALPTKEYAEMLQARIDIIKKEILVKLADEIKSGLTRRGYAKR